MGHFNVQMTVDRLTDGLLEGSASGTTGLAFPAIASTDSTPFWQALGSQLSASEMACCLARIKHDTNAKAGGVFTLGGTNSRHFTGDIEFIAMPLGTPTFWLLIMSAITVQGQPDQITTGNISVWVALSFGGQAWPFSATDMNIGQISRGSSNALGPSSTSASAVTFLLAQKNVYSVFRAFGPGSIEFAQLSSVAGGSGLQALERQRRIINQNYIACHDDHRSDYCPHVLVVIQIFSMSLQAFEVLYTHRESMFVNFSRSSPSCQ
ncbi:aspartic peptidase [Laccaria bicolor S238N-H82]|uniref:Aspartic peptidase n=1 Tax=Laccaria bicolor (strain S238N-H82 / ATCC MYA-4686) TaxID=486041 RepID=B0CUD0_LACBS|nr:aspartic peptidase [Laccaria bicolor S238N-H82]EDR14073.1 aspartic peptidase [Laccaria bicolor S238N-H82]|eukprot:XP_001874632.1 aspartic peptidase [Laccaria bicolor S238N-H82]